MKKWILIVLASMLAAGIGAAQTQTQTRSGIGLVFTGDEILSDLYYRYSDPAEEVRIQTVSLVSPPPIVMVPINTGNLKIEPEFGWMRLSQKSQDTTTNKETAFSANAFRIGCGLFSVRHIKRVNFYFGARLGVVLASENYTDAAGDESSVSVTNIYVGPCAGGEYMISESFSFGGEAQLIYTKVGQPKYEYKGKAVKTDVEISASTFDTRYMFIFRWYM